MKKKKNNVNYITIISIIIVLLVLGLSIGWSSLNSSLRIDSATLVRIETDIRITGFSSTTGTNGGISDGADYYTKFVTGSVTLPNSNSTVTYRVEITNMQLAANTYMGIDTLTGLPNNLEIKNITDYTLRSKICDDNDPTDCGSGSQKTFYITIGYKNNAYDANNTSYGFVINFDFKKVFDITYSGFTNPPAINTAMDGDTPTINFNSDAQSVLNITSGGVALEAGVNYSYSNRVLAFVTPITDHVFINNPATYNITYVLNGGEQVNNQITSYTVGVTENILPLTSTVDRVFNGWYQSSNFSGTAVTDTSGLVGDVTLYAKWTYKVAMIGNTYYLTLQNAITAATNNTDVTIELIHDASENVSIGAAKRITINFNGNTLRNKTTAPVIANAGVLNITNGTITSNGTQGAINNNSGATLNMSGGTVSATGTRQAIYNDGGTVNISGTATLSATTNERAVVQNQAGSTLNITGGTITSTGYVGVQNSGTMTIGTAGGGVSKTSPAIIGKDYGVLALEGFDFYDGRISGKQAAVDDETQMDHIETSYELVHKLETINNETYHSLYLALSTYRVIFDPGDGMVDETERYIESGGTVGVLPTATRTGYILEGWYDDDNDHHKVTASEVINGNVTFYAHWADIPKAVRVGSTEYIDFMDGWATVPDNTQTTVTLLADVSLTQILTISSSKDIIFDLNGKTIDTTSGTIFENYGTLVIRDSGSGGALTGGKIINNTHIPVLVNKSGSTVTISGGTISSNASQVVDNSGLMYITGGTITIGNVVNGVLNNNAGATLRMSGGTISATVAGSKRQAIYNKGTAYISGTATLISASTDRAAVHNDASGAKIYISGGTITSTNTNCERGAVQNSSGATVEITGGTIISKSTKSSAGAVQNAGTLILGSKDGSVNSTSPDLMGNTYGVNNSGTFKFYDGILKGKLASINGNLNDYDPAGTRVDTTDTINGVQYYVTYYN